MVEMQINQKLPYVSQIDDAALGDFLTSCEATCLQSFTEKLAAAENISLWIKEAATFEIAHRRALQDKTTLEAPDWFEHTTPDELALMNLTLAPETELYPFGHDIISWYSAKGEIIPEERECFTVVGKGMQHISEGQYYLLEAINQTSLLGDAFDRWVQHFPQQASDDASNVGCWLQNWIKQGILIR